MKGRSWDLDSAEGWQAFVDAPRRDRPERLTEDALRDLSDDARYAYQEQRSVWHVNFGIIKTPQLAAAEEMLDLIVSTNLEDADRTRGAAVIDALPGLGKTTLATAFAKNLDHNERMRFGQRTADGDLRVPVFRVGLEGKPTLKSLNWSIAAFYGHPGAYKTTTAERLAGFAADCVRRCETTVGIIDDVHRINPAHHDGQAITEHLKYLSDKLPITFIYIGVDLEGRGLYAEGLGRHRVALAQTGRRWTKIGVAPYTIADDHGRKEWLLLIRSIEEQLVLVRHAPKSLLDHASYLFDRTGGYIGSLMALLTRSARLAITSGEEKISREILDRVVIDHAAESGRQTSKLA